MDFEKFIYWPVNNDPFGKFVKNHTGSSQYAGKDTDREGNGIDESVGEGMKTDSKHGHEAYFVLCIRFLNAHKSVDEPK